MTDFIEDIPITLEEGNRHENHSAETENSLEDQGKIGKPLQNYQKSTSESPVGNNNIHEIAPGEDFSTKKNLYEELVFQQYFSKDRFGYSAERIGKLIPSKYFNQRLLNYKQIFGSNNDYIFLAQSVLQGKNFMKKKTVNFTADMFKNYKHSVKALVRFYFIYQIRGTPAYW